mmetsp:Transcript_40205/g.94151  ORF Transcript_40205/g.94151 Transcript_40205/m.94151 type:complete len:89 (-) Transcript_40205:865-1131(-)
MRLSVPDEPEQISQDRDSTSATLRAASWTCGGYQIVTSLNPRPLRSMHLRFVQRADGLLQACSERSALHVVEAQNALQHQAKYDTSAM